VLLNRAGYSWRSRTPTTVKRKVKDTS
jgi:hypothetical protein